MKSDSHCSKVELTPQNGETQEIGTELGHNHDQVRKSYPTAPIAARKLEKKTLLLLKGSLLLKTPRLKTPGELICFSNLAKIYQRAATFLRSIMVSDFTDSNRRNNVIEEGWIQGL